MAGETSTPGSQGSPYVGSTNVGGLSDWAGGTITDMVGRAAALSKEPYQVYGGPLTAEQSALQKKVFSGLESINFPSNLGQSFSSTGAYKAPTVDASGIVSVGSQSPTGIAAQYMNPYLQAVLDPQLAELNRVAQIERLKLGSDLSKSGAYGGGRQAVMESELTRNMLNEANKAIGTAYSNAYDKAMGQFNTEQGQAKTLVDILSEAGKTQRDIEQQGVTADYNEFLAQRDDPYKKIEFLSKVFSGLPISTVSNVPGEQTGIGAIVSTLAGLGVSYDNLVKLGILPKPTT